MTTGTPADSADKAAALLALHSGPGFVLPNAWDAGSARVLEQVGFPAVATTSAGIAWSCTLFSLGVRRVSLGGSLARASLSLLERAGRELLDTGTLGFLDGALSYAELQRRFGAGLV